MKKFLFKMLIFLGISMVSLTFFLILSSWEAFRVPIGDLTQSAEYGVGNVGSPEIIPYIEKVQEKNSYSKLIIGDSVCGQIYNRFQDVNEEYCISGTNQAITLAGQYILTKEFLENHDEVTDVYLVIIMHSLRTEFSAELGY